MIVHFDDDDHNIIIFNLNYIQNFNDKKQNSTVSIVPDENRYNSAHYEYNYRHNNLSMFYKNQHHIF